MTKVLVSGSTPRVLRVLSLFIILSAGCFAQNTGTAGDGDDDGLTWDTRCVEKTCVLFTEVLGESGSPTAAEDPSKFVAIGVKLDRSTLKPQSFVFLVPPNAEQNQGVVISFGKAKKEGDHWTTELDVDGASRIPFASCDKNTCTVQVPGGLLEEGKESHRTDLLYEFLHSGYVLFLYWGQGKAHSNMVLLSPFKKTYEKVRASEIAAPKGHN